MAEEKDLEKAKGERTSGIFIPAGLFIGMGIGWVLGYLVQGMFIGLGIGFLALAVTMLVMKD